MLTEHGGGSCIAHPAFTYPEPSDIKLAQLFWGVDGGCTAATAAVTLLDKKDEDVYNLALNVKCLFY